MIRPGAQILVLAAQGGGILLCIVGGAVQRLLVVVGDMTPDRTALYFNTNGTLLVPRKQMQVIETGLDELGVTLDASDATEPGLSVVGKDVVSRRWR